MIHMSHIVDLIWNEWISGLVFDNWFYLLLLLIKSKSVVVEGKKESSFLLFCIISSTLQSIEEFNSKSNMLCVLRENLTPYVHHHHSYTKTSNTSQTTWINQSIKLNWIEMKWKTKIISRNISFGFRFVCNIENKSNSKKESMYNYCCWI